MGIIQKLLNDKQKALDYHQQAYQINEKIDSFNGMALGQGYIGELFIVKGDLQEGLKHYQKAYDLYQTLGNEAKIKEYSNLIEKVKINIEKQKKL